MRLASKLAAGIVAFLLAGIALLCVAGLLYEPNVEIPAGLAGRHVSIGGVPIRVQQEGQGPDVLLIHGSPGSLEDWSSIVPLLAGEARVTRYDRPGQGYSGDTGEYSLAHNADIALALIDTLGLHDVVVAGHSYGGGTALAMALRAPKSVKAYVVIDSATYEPSRPVTVLYRMLTVPAFGFGLARALGPSLAAPRIAAGIAEQFQGQVPPGFVDLRTRIWSTPKVTHAIAAETAGSRAYLALQNTRYGEIHAPLHIVAEADNDFRRTTAEQLHGDVAGSTLRLLPGTGHYVQFEKPQEVAEEIRAALSLPAR